MNRFVRELAAGSMGTGERVAISGGAHVERDILAGPVSVAHAAPLQNPATGRRIFMLGVDSLADLEAGRCELG